MSKLLNPEEIREIRKLQTYLDPYPSADRENAIIKAGAQAQRDISDAENQKKIEEIFRETEEGMAQQIGYSCREEMLSELEMPAYWQALKVSQGIIKS